jgi:hypothetical protein
MGLEFSSIFCEGLAQNEYLKTPLETGIHGYSIGSVVPLGREAIGFLKTVQKIYKAFGVRP